jgi:[acyl-carrier-protein] S-malonyltransferase
MTSPRGATACLFPGQGSQTPEIREQVASAVPQLLERCLELVGEDPFERIAQSTRFAQPAIFCASIAGWVQRGAAPAPMAVAGHSLGELSALVAAGALDALSALKLTVARGALMADATSSADGMLAILGGSLELVRELAQSNELVVANDNAPGQLVLSGRLTRLRRARDQARAQGLRAMELGVTGAFHSPAMSGAVQPFREALDRVHFSAPAVPVISSSTAASFRDPRAELSAAIVKPVRWRETMSRLAEIGANSFVDVGPGEVLARLVKRNISNTRPPQSAASAMR